MTTIAQYKRDLLLERKRERIEVAKRPGKYKGRQRVKKPDNFDECYKKYTECSRFNKYTFKQFMLDTGLKKQL
jgi:DNA invertase Pin-like site-specific DNA recombinase